MFDLQPSISPRQSMRHAAHRLRLRLAGKTGGSTAGFTLLELIVVVAMIGILAALALPNLVQMPLRSKEAVLKNNLRTLRQSLDQYNGDLGHYPESLEALVDEGYLRKIPLDPIVEEREWETVYDDESATDIAIEVDLEIDGIAAPGVIDVFSTSPDIGLNGTPYNEW